MGLGKTLQVVAFVHTLLFSSSVSRALNDGPIFDAPESGDGGDSDQSALMGRKQRLDRILVVTPSTTVSNWVFEFSKWKPPGMERSSYLGRIHDFSDVPNADRLRRLDLWHHEGGVVVISYELFETLVSEKVRGRKPKTPTARVKEAAERGARTQLTVEELLCSHGPDLVVCDEGHRLKNINSKSHIALSRIRTSRRVILTGTPIQNNLMELYAIVAFVRPHLLGDHATFKSRFVVHIEKGQNSDATTAEKKRGKQKMVRPSNYYWSCCCVTLTLTLTLLPSFIYSSLVVSFHPRRFFTASWSPTRTDERPHSLLAISRQSTNLLFFFGSLRVRQTSIAPSTVLVLELDLKASLGNHGCRRLLLVQLTQCSRLPITSFIVVQQGV